MDERIVMNEKIDKDISCYFDDVQDKERLMYGAVVKMVQEGFDMNSIKVSDITKRAGIGKGTAYEYFGSKEEIIVKALLYDTFSHLKKIDSLLEEKNDFSDKYYILMNYLEDNISQVRSAGNIFKIFAGAPEAQENMKRQLEDIQKANACPVHYIEGMIDVFMQQGFDGGKFNEEDVIIRRSAFASQITGYIYCILNNFYNGKMDRQLARDFSYNGLIKLLTKS